MAKSFAFIAFVDDRPLWNFDDKDGVRECLRKFIGDEIVVRIEKRQHRQGDAAMRYYRGVVVPDIAHAMGYSDPDDYEQVHQALAWKFLRIDDHPTHGYPRRRSTGKDDMSREELSAYIDRVITWAEAELAGCRIRRPHEVDLDRVPYDKAWEKDEAAA